MQIARKITVGGINNVRGGFECKPDESRLVARIFGMARGSELKESNYGPYMRFKGEFRAINGDGEEFAATILMLPEPASSMLAEAVAGDETKTGVQFAFDIFVQGMPKKQPGDRGYQFVIKPLLETAPSDPLKALAGALPALQIAAPKQPELPEVAAQKTESQPAMVEDAPKGNTKKK